MTRYARSRDGNEPEIIAALQDAGATVQKLYGMDGEPDLLVGYEGVTFLIEVKNPSASRSRSKAHDGRTLLADEVAPGGEFEGLSPRLSRRQARWHMAWKGQPVAVVETPCDALTEIGAPCLCELCAAEVFEA